MSDAVGTFRIDFEIENPSRPGTRRVVKSALVDTGAELSWIPSETLESLGIERYARSRFRQANRANPGALDWRGVSICRGKAHGRRRRVC